MSEERFESKLYLVVEADAGAADRLAAALAAAPVASVLVRPSAGASLDAGNSRPLVELAQKAGAAVLLADAAELARTLRADGVHLSACEDPAGAYEAARAVVGGRGIVGADAGTSRDDAMTLAEVGADYVAFGAAGEDGPAWRLDRCQWWAEIFEVPCVALDVATPDEACDLQGARCDFIGLVLPQASAPAASRDLVVAVRAALEQQRAEVSS